MNVPSFLADLRLVAAGHPWTSTDVYASAVEKIRRGELVFREFSDIEDFERRWCARYESVLRSIQEHGYTGRRPSATSKPDGGFPSVEDDVRVAIGRDGSFLVWEGMHRVHCAAALDVETIPARVIFRHPGWVATRQRIAAYATTHGGHVPQPLLHPDLADIPSDGDCASLFAAARDALAGPVARDEPAGPAATLLDLFPGWGYYSHRFRTEGYACTAVDGDDGDSWFLETLRLASEASFTVVRAEDPVLRQQQFDAAVALGWARPGEPGSEESRRLIARLEGMLCRELVLQLPPTIEEAGSVVGEQASLVKTVAAASRLASVELVSTLPDGSRLYRFTR